MRIDEKYCLEYLDRVEYIIAADMCKRIQCLEIIYTIILYTTCSYKNMMLYIGMVAPGSGRARVTVLL